MSEHHNVELSATADAVAEAYGTDEFYGSVALRWYQIAARNGVVQAILDGERRILIELPTGAGKTLTVACTLGCPDLLKAMNISGRPIRILFVAHTHRLLTQAEQTFIEDANVEVIMQSMFSEIPQDVIDRGWDICVLDEAHHEACSSFQYHLERLGDFPIIGLTATPDRPDGCVIKFDVIINPISRDEAVRQGYLARTRIHSFVDTPSSDKINVLTDIFTSFGHQFGQTMVFVRTKREVAAVTNLLKGLGYDAVGILSQTERELNAILDKFSAGDGVQFIVNCNKINEGVDVKGCTDVVLGRQYGSYTQLNQVIGRASRPDSDCNVWELVNPLSGRNLDTTVVVGTPEYHRLVSKESGVWVERQFDYVTCVNEDSFSVKHRSAF